MTPSNRNLFTPGLAAVVLCSTACIARGSVEDIAFTGALERLRIRLLDEPCAAQLLGSAAPPRPAWKSPVLSRNAANSPLRLGTQISLGARRLHILPTPISSFLACAPTAAEAENWPASRCWKACPPV